MSEQEIEVLDAETEDQYNSVAEEIKDSLLISLRSIRDAEDEDGTLMIEAQRDKSICNIANSICNMAKTQILIQSHNIRVGIPVTEVALEG